MARIYGIGVDVAFVPRFQRIFARYSDQFLKKAFHPTEIEEFYKKSVEAQPVYLASRWAVKEATFKAFQCYRILFPEIYLRRKGQVADPSPPVKTALPVAEYSQALELQFCGDTLALAQQLSITTSHVSISHDQDYAVAYVVLQQNEKIEPVDSTTSTV